MPRRYLIAPDKFKGSLTASQAANAIAEGIRRVDPEAQIDLCPIADGGEGFMEALALAMGGNWITCPAVDPLGRHIESRYVLVDPPEGLTAILEMAETSGLWRLTPEEQNPLLTTTRGVGMQLAHAVSNHAVKRVILGIGGSSTNDGGTGMAAALGVRFFDEKGKEFDPIPTNLTNLHRVDARKCIRLPEIIVACDVDNPLLGERGATAIFSTQKGATTTAKVTLEHALSHLVSVTNGHAAAQIPGSGAAGGLGFGLLYFTHARLVSGFDMLANLLNLDQRIQSVDHVITGEGSLDAQSLFGKGPGSLARLAKSLLVPVTGFCGVADQTIRACGIFDEIYALADTGLPIDTLIAQAGPLLVDLVADSIHTDS